VLRKAEAMECLCVGRMTEVIKIMCAKDGGRYEVSVSRMIEVLKNMCAKDG
jgi:hypothetical protein